LSLDLVPNALGHIGTGLWLQPVPILRTLALGQASTQCRLVPKAKAPGADDLVSMTWCRLPGADDLLAPGHAASRCHLVPMAKAPGADDLVQMTRLMPMTRLVP